MALILPQSPLKSVPDCTTRSSSLTSFPLNREAGAALDANGQDLGGRPRLEGGAFLDVQRLRLTQGERRAPSFWMTSKVLSEGSLQMSSAFLAFQSRLFA